MADVVDEPYVDNEMSENMEEVDEDTKDFQNQMQFINNSMDSVNIFDQIPSYDYVDTQMFLENISKELEQQKTLNKLLLSNEQTVKTYVEKIKAFSAVNSSKVQEQLNQISSVSAELKSVVQQNASLKEKYSEITELSSNENYVLLARNIQELKKQKQDILDFLKKSQIIAPPLSA
jgi:hypothetical protein